MTSLPPSAPGAALKKLREARGLTQQALADKLGKSRTAVAAWEYGRAMSAKSRTQVAKLLGVDPDVLGPPWNPNGARPQHRRRAREEAAYMEDLRALGTPGAIPIPARVDPDEPAGVSSQPPAPNGGSNMRDRLHGLPDADQLEKFIHHWCAMAPEHRPALVHQAWTLCGPAVPEKQARGKAQG